jgi:hypothetical protein
MASPVVATMPVVTLVPVPVVLVVPVAVDSSASDFVSPPQATAEVKVPKANTAARLMRAAGKARFALTARPDWLLPQKGQLVSVVKRCR